MATALSHLDTYYADPVFPAHMVARATTWRAFQEVVQIGMYKSVLHTPDNWDSERDTFQRAYANWRQPTDVRCTDTMAFEVIKDESLQDTACMVSGVSGNFPHILMTELMKMVVLYAQLTGAGTHATRITGMIDENINFCFDHEPHSFPVLNRTLFAPGTVLRNGPSQIVGAAPEGDYLYMQPDVYHHSTRREMDASGLRRVSLIVYSPFVG